MRFVTTGAGVLEQAHNEPILKIALEPTVGTGDTYGTEVTYDPTGRALFPIAAQIEFKGIATGETVTTVITAYLSNGTTADFTKSATSATTYTLTGSDLISLVKDKVYVYKLGAKAKSDQASTSAAVTITIVAY